jgi:hypothetical protein
MEWARSHCRYLKIKKNILIIALCIFTKNITDISYI